MNFYDSEENIRKYIGMSGHSDGRFLIERLRMYLPSGRAVLELGMGPGTDLNILQKHYRATGSDISKPFLERYQRLHPQADLLRLNAVSIETERRFGGIYSNKVLQHLSYEDMRASFLRQAQVLSSDGIAKLVHPAGIAKPVHPAGIAEDKRAPYPASASEPTRSGSPEIAGTVKMRTAGNPEAAGIALHSFWYGTDIENFKGLMFYQVTEEKLQSILPPCYAILDMERYTEEVEGDSLYVILRAQI